MCDDYEPIDEEMLYGVPVEDLPEQDPERNYFDEGQPIKKVKSQKLESEKLNDD